MEKARFYYNGKRHIMLKFMSTIKGYRITSLNNASQDFPFTYGIAKKLNGEELIHLTEQIEKIIGG